MTAVFVDARNVLRSQWPNLPEEELVERARAWAARHGRSIVLVFDGKATGSLVGVQELDEGTTLVGCGGGSAGDWLIREVPRHPGGWLVTSDRALRAAAGRQTERVIGGGSFLRELDD